MVVKNRMIKRYLVILLVGIFIISFSGSVFAIDYYVDAINGNDYASGISVAPWKTISKVNSMNFEPGDNIYFKRGQTWNEQLTISSSGNGTNWITFGSYGSGEKPEINGADLITGWEVYDENIYVADVSSEVRQLFINGERQTLARWPNSGWQNISANSEIKTRLYSESLIQPDDYWKNAIAVIRTANWRIETKTITANNQNENAIVWDGDVYLIQKDWGFYIENKLEEIDMQGEWYYDISTKRIFLYLNEDPANYNIEGSVRDYGIKTLYEMHHININNFSIIYSKVDGIHTYNSDYINIEDNIISFTKRNGIRANIYPDSEHGHIHANNNLISYTQGEGIVFSRQNYGEIINNNLFYIGVNEVSPKKVYGVMIGGMNHIVSHNKIDDVSYDGIYLSGGSTNVSISNNLISRCLLSLSDGGGIYTASWHNNLVIENNIVHDIVGNAGGTPSSTPATVIGIYLDELAEGITVRKNIIYNCNSVGMMLHRTHNNTIINNVIYNTPISVYMSEKSQDEMYDNNFYNNIFLSSNEEQLTFAVGRYSGSTTSSGDFDYNIHYNPYNENVIRYYQDWKTTYYTFSQWQTFSGQEPNGMQADPLFTDILNNDFNLQSTSPAIDAGVDVGLIRDFIGTLIPQGSAPDIGAYEYIQATLFCTDGGGICKINTCDNYTDCNSLIGICATGSCCFGTCTASSTCGFADTDTDGIINIIELMDYISQWKTESVTTTELMIGIGEWKNGC